MKSLVYLALFLLCWTFEFLTNVDGNCGHICSNSVTHNGGHGYNWRTDRRPRIWGHRIPKSSMSPLNPPNLRLQKKIVAYHNFFRSNVKPQAGNMLEMTWHRGAASMAQSWASKCHFLQHDNATDRWTEQYGGCGQNIFISTHRVPWFFAIKSWFLEYHNFTYGSPKNDLGVVGHYTQMVWATSHKVGCGYAECTMKNGKPFYNLICNYCPTGNYMDILGQPYAKGPQCSSCPNSCSRKTQLCTNPCPFADQWINCSELKSQFQDWLCSDPSPEGQRRKKHCRATCHCGGTKPKIYQDFQELIRISMAKTNQVHTVTTIVKHQTQTTMKQSKNAKSNKNHDKYRYKV